MVEYDEYRFKTKEKPRYVKEERNTYWLVCAKKTDNKRNTGVALVNEIGQQILENQTF